MSTELSQIFGQDGFLFIFKIATLVFLAIYIIFTIVVFTQVKTMNRILKETFASNTIEKVALANIILPLSLFLISLVIL